MKDQDLLPSEGNFYKANLHNHCTISDGEWTKEQVKDEYMKRGYSIVAFSDHNYYEWHKDLCDEHFIAIAAMEENIDEKLPPNSKPRRFKTFHINFYDTKPLERKDFTLPPVPQNYHDKQSINDYIKTMNELGFLTCYNHPWWSLQTYDDYKDLKGLFAMEIYNHNCEMGGLYGYAPQVYDEILRTGQRIFCVATDDNHNRFPVDGLLCDSFGGWTNIKAKDFTYDSIIEALKLGNFYASSGPELHELSVKDDTVHIKCSPVQKIYMVTETRRCQYTVSEPNGTITEAHFKLDGHEGYIRIDCEDASRKHAYSNAYYLDRI